MPQAKDYLCGIVNGQNIITIGAGESVSTPFDSFGATVCGLYFPSNFTPCTIVFDAHPGAYDPAFFDWSRMINGQTNLAVSIVAGDTQYIDLSLFSFVGVNKIRLVCLATQVNDVQIIVSGVPLVQKDFN